jgi:hypothetical protein
LQALSQGVFDVSMTFDSVPATIEADLAALPTIRTKLENHTVEATFKAPEGQVLELVTALAKNRRVLRLEVNGASLEDIFLDLTSQGRNS